jgi:hypothetical protein
VITRSRGTRSEEHRGSDREGRQPSQRRETTQTMKREALDQCGARRTPAIGALALIVPIRSGPIRWSQQLEEDCRTLGLRQFDVRLSSGALYPL